MEITPKAIRRAQVKLLSQAKVEAKEKNVEIESALLSIIERCQDPEVLQKAFSKVDAPATKIEDTSGPRQPANQEIPDY